MRINLYPLDTNPSSNSKLLGTNVNGQTKNYLLSDLKTFITSGLSISGVSISGASELSQTITPTNGLSASSIYLSASPTIGLRSIVVSGSSVKPTYDIYGRIVSGGSLTSADIPNLSPSQIIQNTSNRFVTDTQIAIWNANTSGVSAVIDLSTSLKQEARKNKLILLSAATTQVASASPLDENYTLEMSPIFAGQRQKTYIVSGPTSGSYQATVTFLGTDVDRGDWVYPDNCVITTITNTIPSTSATFQNDFIVYGVILTIDSGMVPAPGIYASVEV